MTEPEPPPRLTDRFLDAVALASEIHGDQRRLGTRIPYLAHLLVVTGLVLEEGGDEDAAIAALLHDAVEDGGGPPVLERIEARFGERVATIVRECSDTMDPDDGRSWRERKQAYIGHLPEVDDDSAIIVSLADKVHNARSIVREYRKHGDALWGRFADKTAGDQLWYYTELLAVFAHRHHEALVEDLVHARDELAGLLATADVHAVDPAAPAVEIERKFVLPAAPPDLGRHPSERIEQGYLAVADDGVEVRVRRRGDAAEMTVKSGPAHVRVEEEISLSPARFAVLWPLTEGRRLTKTRHRVPLADLVAEVDVYDGLLAGLVVAEVEFGSLEASSRFAPPDWFGSEVTGDPRYANQSLARSAGPPG
jgi:CYTH domain-containing protein